MPRIVIISEFKPDAELQASFKVQRTARAKYQQVATISL